MVSSSRCSLLRVCCSAARADDAEHDGREIFVAPRHRRRRSGHLGGALRRHPQTCGSHYPVELLERWASTPLPATFGQRIEDEYIIVGMVESRIAGFASLKASDCLVDAVFVAPSEGRRGLGRRLLVNLEEFAIELGLQTLRVNASLNAAPFYAAAGYEALSEEIYTTSAGVQIACVRMEKTLAPQARAP